MPVEPIAQRKEVPEDPNVASTPTLGRNEEVLHDALKASTWGQRQCPFHSRRRTPACHT